MPERLESASYYDAFSETYEVRRHHGYHLFLDDMQAALLRRYVRPGDRLLEIGCGTGLLMQRIAPHAGSVVGIDLSPGMLARAREKGLAVQRADASSLPFPDASFDVVYSFKVLAHVPTVREAVAECGRVLRPGGLAVLEFYNARSLRAWRKRWVRGRVAPEVREDQVFTRYDTPKASAGYLGEGLRLEAAHGVMVVTPAAQVHSMPLVRPLVQALERVASRSALTRYGGFLTLVARRSDRA